MNEGKATRYHRLKRRTGLLTAVGSGAVLAWLLTSGASAGIRDVITHVVAVPGLPRAVRQAGLAAVYTTSVWIVLEGLLLPVRFLGLSGFPNAETLNLTMSYVDVGLIGHRVQTRKGPV